MLKGRELLETWFKRVWSDEDQSAIDELLCTETEVSGLGLSAIVGPEEFKTFHTLLLKQLSNVNISIDKYIEQGAWGSALCTLTAVSKTNEKTVNISGSAMVRIGGGKIQVAYNHFDFLSMWAQMGLLPSDSFEKALNGQKVV